MKYQRFTSGIKDIGIKKIKLMAKTHFIIQIFFSLNPFVEKVQFSAL